MSNKSVMIRKIYKGSFGCGKYEQSYFYLIKNYISMFRINLFVNLFLSDIEQLSM